MDYEYKIKELESELEKTKKELNETKKELNETKKELNEIKEYLQKYTATERSKILYENHKIDLLQKNNKYKEKLNYYGNIPSER